MRKESGGNSQSQATIFSKQICTIVVTFNRNTLLTRCLEAISAQSLLPTLLLIVDNASTDGTEGVLRDNGWLSRDNIEWLPLRTNVGGAGGFSAGLHWAIENSAEWLWLMDDDAVPKPDALQELMGIVVDPNTIYGSLAVQGDEPAWTTTVVSPPLGAVKNADDVPLIAEVESIPFLGFLIHRNLVEKIGLPDAGFFIAADDAEYCLRARRAGAKIVIAGKSRIEHPKSKAETLRVFGKEIIYLSLPPWKRYYDTRNRLLIAHSHHGFQLFTQTLPGSFVRLFAALAKEPNKLAQTYAFFAGLIDGLLGIKGKRHEIWGIKP